MEEKIKNEELQSRREFFKKTAQNVLPFLGIVAFSPLLTSCKPDYYDPDDDEPSGCGNSCSGSCYDGCTNNCDSLCGGDCWAYCESKVKV